MKEVKARWDGTKALDELKVPHEQLADILDFE
jgi:hypothetical protein